MKIGEMKIGELAKLSGLAPSRIRYYESNGLISSTRGSNGYREFARQTVLRLEIIVKAQQAGFSLEEIHHLLPNQDSDKADPAHQAALLHSLRSKVVEIDAIVQRLSQNKAHLLAIIAKVEGLALDDESPCSGQIERLMDSLKATE